LHELSLSSAIVDTVERHAAGRRVTAVHMTIGALRQVVPESLEFYFGIVSRDTVCDGAALRITLLAGRACCDACGREWELELPLFLCAACGAAGRPVSGEEFEVESIDVIEAEEREVAHAPH
jgi:hydrogenase nickel incorporation protein HypA/HybF